MFSPSFKRRSPLGIIDSNKDDVNNKNRKQQNNEKQQVYYGDDDTAKNKTKLQSPKELFEVVRQSRQEGNWSMDDYSIKSELGSGGVATVYNAIEKTSGYQVAIKVQSIDSDDAISEILLHRKLNHISIVNVIGYFCSDHQDLSPVSISKDDDAVLPSNDKKECLCIILELCEQGSLSDIIDKRDCGLSEKEAAGYFINMINALEYLHCEHQLIHSDIKPTNFLIDKDSNAKLCDFGMAIPFDSNTIVGGSVQYMAPEYLVAWYQFNDDDEGEKVFDNKVDIYSLGVTLFEMLFGYLPYDVIENNDLSPLLNNECSSSQEEVEEVHNIRLK